MNHNSKPCIRSPYLPKIGLGTKVGAKPFLGNFPLKMVLPKARSKTRLMREAHFLYSERSSK